ncbi:MAG: SDR family NAD(P)-dependent oxidoreductase [Propionibacteriaceae bacterium]|jgi:acyl transferase domain-containing protein|nr:SDR family NAD(P)-dependent oxidoreductase [Propionibacteriaceae bacterium]
MPDVRLAVETIRAGAKALLHLGRDADRAAAALAELADATAEPFGVVYAPGSPFPDLTLPDQVNTVVAAWGEKVTPPAGARVIWQVTSLAEGRAALAAGVTDLAVKGAEAGGRVGQESAFLLFQGLLGPCRDQGVRLVVHGGAGVHNTAAYWALGADAVLVDSQVALFPEASLPKDLKATLAKLNGGETQLIGGFRVLRWPAGPHLADDAAEADVLKLVGGYDIETQFLPTGQDFALAGELVTHYTTLKFYVRAVHEAAYGHLRQAQATPPIRPHSPFAQALGTEFPVIQGPMARVSDEPEFLLKVAEAGGLPSLAMGLAADGAAQDLLDGASALLAGRPWAAGLLGFMEPRVFDDQVERIFALANKPTAVVIAGGRVAQGKKFEAAGIQAFLHIQSPTLFDQYVKEGARGFIFEGRESGGHVGPTPSALLWERMLFHVIDADDPASLSLVFAGGLHDALSSAFVSIMTASVAARGAKVGLLLGSAYLFSPEAVATHAITQRFQEIALEAEGTLLLESAKGQETRVLPTPFADFFLAEKARVQALDLDDVAKRAALEELNLGRARIASKGVDRADHKTEVTHAGARAALGDAAVAPDQPGNGGRKLVKLTPKQQTEQGMFMCGDITALIHDPRPIAATHAAVTTAAAELIAGLAPSVTLDAPDQPKRHRTDRTPDPKAEPIAIIGMAGIFPQADNVDEYWRNVVMGVDTVIEVPKSRWDADVFYNPETQDTDFVCSKWGSFLSPAEFDPLEFGVTPQSVHSIETTQLIGLLVAKRALEDAGYTDFKSNMFQDTSVIFGVEAMGELSSAYGSRPGIRQLLGSLPDDVSEALPRLTEDSFAGVLSNVTSGRISNRLNCGGRNYTVDAACASSLASIDLACQELWMDRSNMVVCGGVDLHNSILDYLFFNATYALSRRGFTATFDESGDGLTPGEGAGALVLKRLSDAERDHDRIYAVIRGVHGSSDGRSLGLTAPNIAGQTRAVKRAYEMAGLLPSEVGLIEAHGTGTSVGDRTELLALTNIMLDAGALPAQIYAGSVKTQIGHAKCAAGVAGVIRAALSLYHGVIPPTIHLEKPVRTYVPGRSPLVFNANGTAKPWTAERRLAGVSGFGFGGTNYHTILQNYEAQVPDEPVLKAWPAELIVFRGADAAAARQQMRQVKALWDVNRYLGLADVALTLAQSEGDIQVAFVAKNWADLLAKIDAALGDGPAPGVYRREPKPGQVAFLFSGQGSQRVNMARELFVLFPGLRDDLAAYPEYFSLIFPPSVFTDAERKAQQAAVTDTRHAQPLLGFVDLAIARALGRVGVVPDLVAGHSYGELAALSFAGVLPAADLPGLSRQRAEAILGATGADPGTMAAVSAGAEEVARLLEGVEGVWAVNLNSPRQTVVGGSTEAVAAFLAQLKEKGVKATPVEVACAFHTPLVAGADQAFAAALKPVKLGKAGVPVWSNTTAQPYPATAAAIRRQIAGQLVQPVRFADELRGMYEAGARVFVEAGPGGILTGLVRDTLGDTVTAIQTERDGAGIVTFLDALARWVATGRELDFAKLFEGRRATPVDLAEPTKHAQNKTVFMVDGLEAVPIAQWRDQGYEHLERKSQYTEEQLRQMRAENLGGPGALGAPAGTTPEDVVQTYLANVRSVLDDQRDVLLGYLGYQPGARARVEAALPGQELEPVASQEVVVLEGEIEDDESASVLLQLKDLTPEMVHDIVIEVVSEKTGYPPEMLGLDMDLEADLSIDSIKRLEIMGSLNERIELPDVEAMGLSEEDSAEALERMAAIKTLRGMIEWLQEIVGQAQAGEFDEYLDRAKAGAAGAAPKALEAAPEAEATGSGTAAEATGSGTAAQAMGSGTVATELATATGPDTVAAPRMSSLPTITDLAAHASNLSDDELEVVRLAISLYPYPHPAGEPLSLEGKRFAVCAADPAVGDALVAALGDLGALVDLVPSAEGADLSATDGLVFVNSHTAGTPLTLEQVFALVKAADMGRVEWLTLFDDTAGTLIAAADLAGVADIQGFDGLFKTLQVEYQDKRVRVVDALQPFDPAAVPALVTAELTDADRFPAIVYDGAERVRFLPAVQPAAGGEPTASGNGASLTDLLDKDSVVLVLGGAQGISPDLMARLAEHKPCHYVLVGRTPRDAELAAAYAGLDDGAALQKHLITVEGFDQPKLIKGRVQSILKAKSVETALAKIEAGGATAEYAAVDLHDEAAFQGLVDRLKRERGHVDAVFHAAAVLEDKLFKDKTWDSFERVYTTKTDPLKVLGPMLDELKLVVLFSSMAASFGNRGQCDYAAANSVFDTLSFVLHRRGAPAKAVAVAWGPWKGAGMVSTTLETEMKKRGLSLIPLSLGADFLVGELTDGHDPLLIAVAGRSAEIEGFIDQVFAAVAAPPGVTPD